MFMKYDFTIFSCTYFCFMSLSYIFAYKLPTHHSFKVISNHIISKYSDLSHTTFTGKFKIVSELSGALKSIFQNKQMHYLILLMLLTSDHYMGK